MRFTALTGLIQLTLFCCLAVILFSTHEAQAAPMFKAINQWGLKNHLKVFHNCELSESALKTNGPYCKFCTGEWKTKSSCVNHQHGHHHPFPPPAQSYPSGYTSNYQYPQGPVVVGTVVNPPPPTANHPHPPVHPQQTQPNHQFAAAGAPSSSSTSLNYNSQIQQQQQRPVPPPQAERPPFTGASSPSSASNTQTTNPSPAQRTAFQQNPQLQQQSFQAHRDLLIQISNDNVAKFNKLNKLYSENKLAQLPTMKPCFSVDAALEYGEELEQEIAKQSEILIDGTSNPFPDAAAKDDTSSDPAKVVSIVDMELLEELSRENIAKFNKLTKLCYENKITLPVLRHCNTVDAALQYDEELDQEIDKQRDVLIVRSSIGNDLHPILDAAANDATNSDEVDVISTDSILFEELSRENIAKFNKLTLLCLQNKESHLPVLKHCTTFDATLKYGEELDQEIATQSILSADTFSADNLHPYLDNVDGASPSLVDLTMVTLSEENAVKFNKLTKLCKESKAAQLPSWKDCNTWEDCIEFGNELKKEINDLEAEIAKQIASTTLTPPPLPPPSSPPAATTLSSSVFTRRLGSSLAKSSELEQKKKKMGIVHRTVIIPSEDTSKLPMPPQANLVKQAKDVASASSSSSVAPVPVPVAAVSKPKEPAVHQTVGDDDDFGSIYDSDEETS